VVLVVTNPDPRTDRRQLTTVAYGTGDLLADRQQRYRFVTPKQEPIWEWLFALVDGELPEPIVDVGAGNGNYLAALPGRSVVGIDLSRGMLEGIADRGWPLVEADGQAIPLANDAVGTAMANHMLYHVPDIALAVRELRRIVRPGGVLLAVTNARDHTGTLTDLLDPQVRERSMTRFTLENGAEFLRTAFTHVERHDRRAEIVCPEVEPVMRYMSSLTSLGVSPEDLAAAERKVSDTIQREGAFRVPIHAGAFLCR
jgi:SAM-dependent methyltransferase